jgi:hypothetical protein
VGRQDEEHPVDVPGCVFLAARFLACSTLLYVLMFLIMLLVAAVAILIL